MDQPYKRRLAMPGMSEADDRLLGMVLAMGSELAVLRERVDTLERLLIASGTLGVDAIESYAPDATALAERDALRQRLIAKLMKPVRDDIARDAQELAGGTTHYEGEAQ